MKNLMINRALAAKKTKLLSLFFVFVASVSSVNAYNAYNNLYINGLYYNLVEFDDELKIAIVTSYVNNSTSYNKNWALTTAVIPESVFYGGDTYSVTRIGEEAFRECRGLTSIEIPNSVTEIENKAFYECTSLTSVTIPNSVIYLGSDVFWNCSALGTITLSENITHMGNNVFYGCNSLPIIDNIRYADTYLIGAVDKTKTNYTIKNGTKWIGSNAFSGCSNITSFAIPNNIRSIGSSIFSGCTNLTTVNIPDNIMYIPQKAFASCTNLTSIGNPNCISTIGEEAFSGCRSLVSLTFTDSLTQIGQKAFQNCSSLESLVIGDSITSIFDYAFYNCSNLVSIVLPESLRYIGKNVFRGCSSLASINIPRQIDASYFNSENNVFTGCTNLTSVTISSRSLLRKNYTQSSNLSTIFGSQVTEYIVEDEDAWMDKIGDFAFYNCTNLTNIILPDNGYHAVYIDEYDGTIWDDGWYGLVSIGNNAFSGCSKLQSINIPKGIKEIGYNAFSGCTSLTSLVLGDSVKNIGNMAFNYCTNLNSIAISSGVKKIGTEAFRSCNNLSKVEINDIASWVGIDFADETANPLYFAKHLYQDDEEIIDLVIPDSATTIKKYAFINCENLQSVSIPYSVEEFDYSAFSGCNNIKSVSINSDAITRRYYSENSNMSTIFGSQVTEYTIGDSVREIGKYAFYECDSVNTFTISDSVTYIGDYAFFSAGKFSRTLKPLYETFKLPANLKHIGYRAFMCWFGLTSLTIPDSVSYIGGASFAGCQNIAYLSLPASLEFIGAECFLGCGEIKSITCRATTPPSMGGSYSDGWSADSYVFMSIDCEKVPLFVPAESIEAYKEANQWSDFTHIYPIEYADNIEISNVSAIPNEDNTVTLTWPVVEEAVIYTIEIKKNGELVCTLEFNADGQLISKVFAMPSRNGNRQTKSATQTANGWQYTIDGLDSGTEYAYTVTAKKADDTEAFTQTITFSTLSHEAIETIETNGGNMTKILHDGQIYIIRGDKTYTLQGQEVK